MLLPDKQVIPVVSGPGIKELESTTHNTVPYDHCQAKPQFTYLQEELAAYSVERNKLHHIYCKKKL